MVNVSVIIVKVTLFHVINRRLMAFYDQSNSLSNTIRKDLMVPNLEPSLNFLNLWSIHLVSDQIDSQPEGQIDYILGELCSTEQIIAVIRMSRSQFDIAEGACQRSLAHSRRISHEGEKKTFHIYEALRTYSGLRKLQGDYTDAVKYAEECYNGCCGSL
jgi:hypothetical protein